MPTPRPTMVATVGADGLTSIRRASRVTPAEPTARPADRDQHREPGRDDGAEHRSAGSAAPRPRRRLAGALHLDLRGARQLAAELGLQPGGPRRARWRPRAGRVAHEVGVGDRDVVLHCQQRGGRVRGEARAARRAMTWSSRPAARRALEPRRGRPRRRPVVDDDLGGGVPAAGRCARSRSSPRWAGASGRPSPRGSVPPKAPASAKVAVDARPARGDGPPGTGAGGPAEPVEQQVSMVSPSVTRSGLKGKRWRASGPLGPD